MTAVVHSSHISVVLGNDISRPKQKKALVSQVIVANPGFKFNINDRLPERVAVGRPFDNPLLAELRAKMKE